MYIRNTPGAMILFVLIAGCTEPAREAPGAAAGQNRARGALKQRLDDPRRRAMRIVKGTAAAVKALDIAPPRAAEKKRPGEIVAACLKRTGGAVRLNGIKMVQIEQLVTGARDVNLLVSALYPDRLRVDKLAGEQVKQTLLLSGGKGHMMTREKASIMSDAGARDLRLMLAADPIAALRAASLAGAGLTYRGRTQVLGREVDVVQHRRPELGPLSLYVAAKDHDLLALRYETSQGQATIFRTIIEGVQGVRLARERKIRVGRTISHVKNLKISVDPKMKAKAIRHYFDPLLHPFYR